ncbi:MAG TPA: sigma-70 family RNA polymerase sigma factor, partial [Armatimonadetes bacterium]|nr:sigma-70 family RNA polymerase sigma factor [Armatimonadota bacterium]
VEGQSLDSAYSDDENSSKVSSGIEVEDWRNAPEVVMEQRELGRAIEEALNALSPDHRAIVVLRDIEGLSYEEIAEVLGCSVAAVKSRLFRARSHLREMLRPYLEP